jgi:hypothetical protein
MTPEKKYTVTIVISFDVDVTASTPEDALEEARHCAINDGIPDTLSETVWEEGKCDPVYEWHD